MNKINRRILNREARNIARLRKSLLSWGYKPTISVSKWTNTVQVSIYASPYGNPRVVRTEAPGLQEIIQIHCFRRTSVKRYYFKGRQKANRDIWLLAKIQAGIYE